MPKLKPTRKAKTAAAKPRKYITARGPEGLARARAYFDVVRGRPVKGERAAGSQARSLRLPDAAWDALETRAAEAGVPVHKLLRQIVADYLYTSEKPPVRTAAKRKSARSVA
jgi:hypothetical protein